MEPPVRRIDVTVTGAGLWVVKGANTPKLLLLADILPGQQHATMGVIVATLLKFEKDAKALLNAAAAVSAALLAPPAMELASLVSLNVSPAKTVWMNANMTARIAKLRTATATQNVAHSLGFRRSFQYVQTLADSEASNSASRASNLLRQ